VAGLGGCPYSPGATGNVATEVCKLTSKCLSNSDTLFAAQDVNHALIGAGFKTNIDVDALVETGEWISKKIGRMNESRAGRAWTAKRQRERRGEEAAKL